MRNNETTRIRRAADDDAEWHMKPLIDAAIEVWKNHSAKILELYRETKDEEHLEDFMTLSMVRWELSSRVSKILFDTCSLKANIEEGYFDVSITWEHDNGLKETISGICHKPKSPKDWRCSTIALVWDDDTVPEVFYGFDGELMRTAVDKLFKIRYPERLKQLHRTEIFGRQV